MLEGEGACDEPSLYPKDTPIETQLEKTHYTGGYNYRSGVHFAQLFLHNQNDEKWFGKYKYVSPQKNHRMYDSWFSASEYKLCDTLKDVPMEFHTNQQDEIATQPDVEQLVEELKSCGIKVHNEIFPLWTHGSVTKIHFYYHDAQATKSWKVENITSSTEVGIKDPESSEWLTADDSGEISLAGGEKKSATIWNIDGIQFDSSVEKCSLQEHKGVSIWTNSATLGKGYLSRKSGSDDGQLEVFFGEESKATKWDIKVRENCDILIQESTKVEKYYPENYMILTTSGAESTSDAETTSDTESKKVVMYDRRNYLNAIKTYERMAYILDEEVVWK